MKMIGTCADRRVSDHTQPSCSILRLYDCSLDSLGFMFQAYLKSLFFECLSFYGTSYNCREKSFMVQNPNRNW